jgi:hypothetical protein
MKHPALYQPGDKVKVLFACKWRPATVLRSFEWPDGWGNTCTSYVVRLRGGTGENNEISCGPNSLRRGKP